MNPLFASLVDEIAAQLGARDSATPAVDGDSLISDPATEARLLVEEALRRSAEEPRSVALQLAQRRLAGELLGHLTGRVSFMGCELLTAEDCVVPRLETEILAQTAIEKRRAITPSSQGLKAIDMCCGAGNLACAIAHHVPQVRVWAADLTDGCCTLARKNAAHLGLGDRVTVLQGDLFAPLGEQSLDGCVDVICCNPPYISTARLDTERVSLLDREPREAFDGGPYGLTIHQRVLRDGAAFLRSGGWLMFEFGVGQERQFELLVKRSRGTFGAPEWKVDHLGRPRAAAIQRL